MTTYTIAAMFRQSFETVASFGFDKYKMYEELGLNLDQLPAEHRLDPNEWGNKVWQVLTRYIPEDEISFRIMERFNMGVFGVAGYVILNSPSFIKAFENFVRFTNLHTNSYRLTLEQGQYVKLFFDRTLSLSYADRFNIEMYVLGFTFNILKLLPQKQWPLEVHYEFDPPKNLTCYEEVFANKTKIYFNASRNMMVYDGALTHIPLLNVNEQLYDMLDKMATESLHKITGEGDICRQVKLILSKRLKGNLPTLDEVAGQLNMSARTLQVKLKSEQKSFRELLDEVRRDIAITHLKAHTLNVSEIAYLLGFSQISSFSAAFKKWTGKTPSAYS